MRLLIALLSLSICMYSCSSKDDQFLCYPFQSESSQDIPCDVNLNMNNITSIYVVNDKRIINTNGIPTHDIGNFPNTQNPFAIIINDFIYSLPVVPVKSEGQITPRIESDFYWGITLNGVLIDPFISPEQDGDPDWNPDLSTSDLGMDCNDGIVDKTGRYVYKSSLTAYVYERGFTFDQMNMVGYAADGNPIYYKYAHQDAMDPSSEIIEMQSSYILKSGEREDDAAEVPCGRYDGSFIQDYELIASLGDLDECNGRFGVTPEYPDGTYYYMITNGFPVVPRCLNYLPDESFLRSN